MSKNRLKQLRIIIPGLIVLFYLAFLNEFTVSKYIFFPEIFTQNSKFIYLIYLIVAILIGGIYHILKIREILWDNYLPLIHFNIRKHLLDISENTLDLNALEKLSDWRVYRDVFYYFIDNDNSLQDRANSVRLNGLFWTTIMDIAIISFVISMITLSFGFFGNDINQLKQGYIIMAICILMLLLIGPVTKSHINEGNKQLEYMAKHYKNEITTKMNEILQ